MKAPAVRSDGDDPLREFRVWSIHIYAGRSPFELTPAIEAPALTASDLTDVDAWFVADPFMLRRGESWVMYFEVLLRGPWRGVIGLATSRDGLSWRYRGIVVDEPFHLSYPHVFEHEGTVYLVPETLQAGAIRLYRCTKFPDRFAHVADLVSGKWADPTVFRHEGRWWMFACSSTPYNRTLHLFVANQLEGPWRPHPSSPVVAGDPRRARPAGRVRLVGDRLIRFAQDCTVRYGHQVLAFEITALNETRYAERECERSPVLTPAATGWNDAGMHHIDPHPLGENQWIACVDGDTYRITPGAEVDR